jgi:hypothetical protein
MLRPNSQTNVQLLCFLCTSRVREILRIPVVLARQLHQAVHEQPRATASRRNTERTADIKTIRDQKEKDLQFREALSVDKLGGSHKDSPA